MAIASFTLAVDRRAKDKGADFISCKAFGKTAEFCEKYARKGAKFAITGSIQTGNYTNKEGQKVYTTDVIIREMEFAESKRDDQQQTAQYAPQQAQYAPQQPQYAQQYPQPQYGPPQGAQPYNNDGFVNVPQGIDSELPFA